jgi:hypothetical protein
MKILLLTVLYLPFMLNSHLQNLSKITFGTIVLYYPDEVLERRVPNLQEMSIFIRGINDALQNNSDAFVTAGNQIGALVIAIKPDGQKNIWFVFEQELNQKIKDQIKDIVKNQKAPTIKEGVFVYGQWLGLNGATITDKGVPSPKEWQAMAKQKNRALNIDEIIDLCWQ